MSRRLTNLTSLRKSISLTESDKNQLLKKLYVIRGSAGNRTTVLRSNTANSSLTIGMDEPDKVWMPQTTA